MEKDRKSQNIQVEIIGGGRVRLSIPGGGIEFLEIPKNMPKGISDTELTALTVMKLAIPITFPEETTGVDQAGFRVRREEDIHSLPGGREGHYKEALSWAGAVLQNKSWKSQRVASLLMEDLPDQVKVGLQLGNITSDYYNLQKARLQRTIAESYPGASASRQRRIDRKIPDW